MAYRLIQYAQRARSLALPHGLRGGADVLPVTSLLPRALFVAAAPNTVTFEAHPELQKRVFELLSLSTAQSDTSDKLAALLCCLPEAAVPNQIGYENTFRVVISQFLDRYNFGLGTVKFVGPPCWGMIKGSQVAGGMLVESLVFAAVFDAIPIVVGIAILRAGWRKYHE